MSAWQDPLVVFGPLLLILTGIVALWARAPARSRRTAGRDAIHLAMTVCGWVMLLVGVFLAQLLFPPAWLVTIVILVAAIQRYRDTEQQSLLWLLTVAAERGIPLEAAARAFAEERRDIVGSRAQRLADYLEAGAPLRLSLERSHIHLAAAAELAVGLGPQTGGLAHALRRAGEQIDEFDRAMQSLVEKFLYICLLILVGCGIIAFLMLKIFPMFKKVLVDYGLELPAPSQIVLGASGFFVDSWFVGIPLYLVLLAVVLFAVLYYGGYPLRRLPLAGRIWWTSDSALVLQWLATAVRQQRPLREFVRLLAGSFPQPRMQSRLASAAKKIDAGAHWCDSLQSASVIREYESHVFKAAERAGNLAWALDEMADSRGRRAAYRMRCWLSVAFPCAVLVLGCAVLLIACSVFLPLTTLIRGLT